MLRTSAGERLWGAAELKGEGGHGPYCCNQNIMNQIWTSASCTFKTTDKRRKKNYLVLIWLPSLPRPANLTCTRKSARSCAVQGRQLACELPPRAPNFSRTKGKEARKPFNSLRNSCFTVQFPRSGVSPPCNWLPRLFSGEATYLAILGQKTSEMLHLTCTMQTGTVKFGLQQNFWQKKITMTPKFYRCRSHTSTLTICHSIPRLPTDTAYKK